MQVRIKTGDGRTALLDEVSVKDFMGDLYIQQLNMWGLNNQGIPTAQNTLYGEFRVTYEGNVYFLITSEELENR